MVKEEKWETEEKFRDTQIVLQCFWPEFTFLQSN